MSNISSKSGFSRVGGGVVNPNVISWAAGHGEPRAWAFSNNVGSSVWAVAGTKRRLKVPTDV